MCLLIHKPKDAELPAELLESAVQYNPHGYGFISLADASSEAVIHRSATTSLPVLQALYNLHRDTECIIHLRYGTSGNVDIENTHPLCITDGIYLAHNGTMNMDRHQSGRSDTWHLVNDYLKPILEKRPELLNDRFFHELVSTWCGPYNKFVFVDTKARQTVIVNRDQGFEVDGVWLSNTRWFDASRFQWHPARSHVPANAAPAFFSI